MKIYISSFTAPVPLWTSPPPPPLLNHIIFIRKGKQVKRSHYSIWVVDLLIWLLLLLICKTHAHTHTYYYTAFVSVLSFSILWVPPVSFCFLSFNPLIPLPFPLSSPYLATLPPSSPSLMKIFHAPRIITMLINKPIFYETPPPPFPSSWRISLTCTNKPYQNLVRCCLDILLTPSTFPAISCNVRTCKYIKYIYIYIYYIYLFLFVVV